MVLLPIAGRALRDSLDVTFRAPAFARGFWELARRRLFELIGQLMDLLAAGPLGTRAAFWVFAALVTAIAGALLVRYVQRQEAPARRIDRGAARWAGDPWQLVDAAIAEERWNDAAHGLYAAVLAALGRPGLVRLHPSKTPGDYARELRAPRARPEARATADAFARFARTFELVAFGPVAPDRARVEALRAEAVRVLGAGPAGVAAGASAADRLSEAA